MLRYVVTFDLKHFVVYLLCRGQTLYQIWSKSSNERYRYCNFNIWPYALKHLSRVALRFEIICTKFELAQPIHSPDLQRFLLMICYITPW